MIVDEAPVPLPVNPTPMDAVEHVPNLTNYLATTINDPSQIAEPAAKPSTPYIDMAPPVTELTTYNLQSLALNTAYNVNSITQTNNYPPMH